MSDPVVTHDPEQRRWEIHVDGELAGFAEYVDKGGRRFFVHTEIDPAHEGRGLGSLLAKGALDAVRADGTPIVPLCPFIAGWIEKHPGYDDLVDHELLDHLESSRR